MKTTRDVLHKVGTHVVARARHVVTGRFGLRATPGGFGTPAFGDDVEVVRVAGAELIRERGGRVDVVTMDGSTMALLAGFAGVDLDAPFSAGSDTPDLGDRDEVLRVDRGEVRLLGDWWQLGWQAMDAVTAEGRDAMAIQLWPEHFDAGTSVGVGDGENDRCNLGASPGDAFSDEPYLYVGPWGDTRPGDPSFWNAPFGAVATRTEVLAGADPVESAVAFFRRGMQLLRSG